MKSLKVFISYSHKDEEIKNEIIKYLKALEKEYNIIQWHDRELVPGQNLNESIDQNLSSSQIIILLVSIDFINSEYCYKIEMKKALEQVESKKSVIIPVIIRECPWVTTPLNKFTIVPQNARPLKKWEDVDAAYMDIYRGIEKQIQLFINENGFDILNVNRPVKAPFLSKNRKTGENPISEFNTYIYENFSKWYDRWYEGHWNSNEPFETLKYLINRHIESPRGIPNNLKILDVACGTGNTYIAFKRAGYDVYGTDGSGSMLNKARENCERIGISTDKLSQTPIRWTDEASYFGEYSEGFFDVIINTANSFCHLPPVDEYMCHSIGIFKKLLKPNGCILIDTKKFIQGKLINGIPIYYELMYVKNDQNWIIRDERLESVTIEKYGEVNFHSRLNYDLDPSFKETIQRAFINVSVFGENITPETFSIPYFPLPAKILSEKMKKAGLKTTIYSGYGNHLKQWKYDLVVGRTEINNQ